MLPRSEHPIIELTIPSNSKKLKVRPMLSKEEKILLTAKASDDDADIFRAIYQVVQNCILDANFSMGTLALFDLELLFLKLRAVSIDNISNINVIDAEDKKTHPVKVDLNEVKIVVPPKDQLRIEVDKVSGIVMRYPSADLYLDKEFLLNSNDANIIDLLITHCVSEIYDGDKIYTKDMFTVEELKAYIDDLPIPVYNKLQQFFNDIPRLKHEIKYKNSLGNERPLVLESLNDFFALR